MHTSDPFAAALRLRTPDESYRIRCPDCDSVLAEYLIGVNRFRCRTCKWQGVISRTPTTLVASMVTIRSGLTERIDSKRRSGSYSNPSEHCRTGGSTVHHESGD